MAVERLHNINGLNSGNLQNISKKKINEIIDALNNAGNNYKSYVALLSQSGTDAPVATVLSNTLGGTLTWSYHSTGSYFGTLTGAFGDGSKVAVFINSTQGSGTSLNLAMFGGGYSDSDSIYITSFKQGTATVYGLTAINGVLDNTPVEIRVYN